MASKTDEISTTDAENVDDSQAVSEVAWEISEHTDQKAAQVASAPPGPLCEVKTKLMEIKAEGGQKQSKVDQTRIRVVQSQDDPASQRREETGKLQEDRSKGVIAKATAEATKAVEKTSVRRLRVCTAEVREGSDGKRSNRMNSQIEQFEKSTEAILSTPQSESEHVARQHAKARVKVKAMTTTKRMTRMMIMKLVSLTVQGDSSTETRTK